MDRSRNTRTEIAHIIVLTGERGVGKSTVCRKATALAGEKKYTCGGIITLRCPNGGRDLFNVHSGDVRRLTLEPNTRPAVIQGRFCFDPETLQWGNSALARAVPCDLLVVDELGPLEIERGAGWSGAFDVLYGTGFVLALVVVRPELVMQAQIRLPGSATTVFTVTPKNRNRLPSILLEVLEREMDHSSR